MISPENAVFTIIAKALRDEFPGIFVAGEYVPAPATFPAVSIVEMDNYVDRRTTTNVQMEHAVYVVYEVNVYSNRTKGKKAECKSIAALIDAEFTNMGFERVMLNAVQNMNDATIYRMVCRYRAVVTEEETGKFMIYRR